MAPLSLYSTCPPLPKNHPGIRDSFSLYNCSVAVRPVILSSDSRTRVFVLSDLHTDYSDNMSWVRSLKFKDSHTSKDVLLVAGDVAETYSNFLLTMSLLKDKFQHVFFVPGNHDLWLRREKADHLGSLDKLDKLLNACQRLGVETKPCIIDGLGIIPLYSWYHESFDGERDITGYRIPSLEMACKDFHVCKWPEELKNGETSLALYFDSLNDKNWNLVEDIKKRCSHIISFSHFVPRSVNTCVLRTLFCFANHSCTGILASTWVCGKCSLMPKHHCVSQASNHGISSLCQCIASLTVSDDTQQELCPEKRMLFYPKLPKVIGSNFLETRIRSIHGAEGRATACHVFGHTHFCWDALLDGIRYVQAPLAYPREGKRRMNGGEEWLPFCIYMSGYFAEKLSPCYWSDYYSINPRRPDIIELAPWVARFYRTRM